MHLKRIAFLFLLLQTSTSSLAQPVITVGDVDGGDTDCDYRYQALQLAIDQVAGMGPGDEVTIRLAVPNGFATLEKSIDSLERDLTLQGGYESCGSENPAVGGYTEIRLPNTSGERLFDIDLTGQINRQQITFDHLILNGQEHDNFVADGALVRVRGPANLILHSTRLEGGRASVIDSGSARGGAVFVSDKASVKTIRRTEFENNQAGLGGALFCDGNAEVILGSTRMTGNSATYGGAIALAENCNRLLFTWASTPWGPTHGLSGNQAMEGGGIYSQGTDIVTDNTVDLPRRFLSISGNQAMAGGAVAFYGDPQNPATLDLSNAIFSSNDADFVGGALYLNGGVDARIRQTTEAALCPGQAARGCTWLRRNFARDDSTLGGGGFAFLDNGSGGLPRLLIERAQLEDNHTDGAAAIAHLEPGSALIIHNSLINDRYFGGGDFLFTADRADELVLMYNTIADTNNVKGIQAEGSMAAYVTGSIYWNDDHPLWTNPDGQASLIHGSCLLTSSLQNLPSPGALITDDPQFDADYLLQAGSPAVNVCDEISQIRLPPDAMEVDFKFEPRGTVTPDHPVQYGPFDLGATALFVDDLFQDRFEDL